MSLSLDSAKALLEPALDGATWDEVVSRLYANTAQLWLGDDCAMVTEIWDDCLHVWLAGGRLKGVLDLRPHVEQAARFWGLKRITLAGRPGWGRVLKRMGYVQNGVELEKRL